MRSVLIGLFIILSATLAARDNAFTGQNQQKSFPEKCLGTWRGTMYIHKNGTIIDSVVVRFTVSETPDPDVYGWKTEYFSEEMPGVKDYSLRLVDAANKIYIIDERNGVELKGFVHGNKLYSVFRVESNLLTSTYEISGDNLVFEVTSGGMLDVTEEVTNYTVNVLQRVVYSKVK